MNLVNKNKKCEIWTLCNEVTKHKLHPGDFHKEFKKYCIKSYSAKEDNMVIVNEYAPKIFRNIRKSYISEETILNSFIPNLNMDGMYHFKTGDGKSPSFFYFTDNKKIMLKTLKESEMEIIFNKDFISNYFMHIMKYPKSLLSKIYGVYQIEIKGKSPI